jgi:hypothetical protein
MQWPYARELADYLREHKPELARELQGRPLGFVLERLNQVTGCNVARGTSINDGCKVFLDALRGKKV